MSNHEGKSNEYQHCLTPTIAYMSKREQMGLEMTKATPNGCI